MLNRAKSKASKFTTDDRCLNITKPQFSNDTRGLLTNSSCSVFIHLGIRTLANPKLASQRSLLTYDVLIAIPCIYTTFAHRWKGKDLDFLSTWRRLDHAIFIMAGSMTFSYHLIPECTKPNGRCGIRTRGASTISRHYSSHHGLSGFWPMNLYFSEPRVSGVCTKASSCRRFRSFPECSTSRPTRESDTSWWDLGVKCY